MADEGELILVKPQIDLADWNKAIASMLADAARIETELKAAFANLGSAIPDVSDLDIAVSADVDLSGIDEFATGLEDIPDSVETEVSADEDTSGIDTFIEEVETVPDAELTTLEADADTTEVESFVEEVESIPDEKPVAVKPAVDPGGQSQLDMLFARLTGINQTIELVQKGFGLLGTGIDIASSILEPVIATDDAMAIWASKTGENVEDMRRDLDNLFANQDAFTRSQLATAAALGMQWGWSKDQILENVGVVADFADTFDKDLNVSMQAFDSMIKAGLISNAQEGFDLLTIAIQDGADKAGDLLSTLQNNAGALKEMGFTGKEAIAGITSGIAAGLPSASSVIDIIRGLVRGEGGTATEAITTLGLGDEQAAREAGELTGGQYVMAVMDALKAQTPNVQKELAAKLFGRASATTGVGNLLSISFDEEQFTKDLVGAGERAAALADDTIRSAFTQLGNTISVEVGNILRDRFNIDEFLDTIKEKVRIFSTEIQAGRGLFGALEIALEMPGLEDKVHRIESAINNFLIGLMQAVADIGQFLGQDVGGLQKEIARISAGQLTFDLQVAEDAQGVQDAVQRAVDRGVAESQLTEIGTKAVTQMVTEGDLTRAQMLVAELGKMETVQPAFKESYNALSRLGFDQETIKAALQDEFKGEVIFGQLLDTSGMQATIDAATATLMAQMKTAIESKDWGLVESLGKQLGADVSGIVQEGQFKSSGLWTNFLDSNMPTQEEVATSVNTVFNNLYNAMQMGDVGAAANWAELLINANDPTVQTYVRDQASTLYQLLSTAMQTGDVGMQTDVMTILGLGDANLQTATANVVLSLQNMRMTTQTETVATSAAIQTMTSGVSLNSDTIQWDLQETQGEFTNVNTVVSTQIPAAQATFEQFQKSIAEGSDPAIGMLVALASQFTSLAESAKAIGGAGAAKPGEVPGHQGGTTPAGTKPGWFIAGERGPEAVFSDKSLSVLNAQTTSALFTALRSMGGFGGGVTNNRTVNAPMQNVFNIQSPAQGMMTAQQTVNSMRGYT